MSRVSEHNASVATVGDLWHDFVARAIALCRTVAGCDLAGLPLYVLLQSEVADVMGAENFSDGYTTPNLDLNLRSVIGEAWQGRGPCMVVNDVSITDEHFLEDVDVVAMSTVLHELAHILDRPTPVDLQSLPSQERIEFETMVISNASRHEHRPLPTPYFGHEEQFIRIAVHLQFRAALVGVATIPNLLCAGRRYGLSHAHRYMEAIGDEPADMLHLPLAEITRTSPPEPFTHLWLSDISKYAESCPQILNGVLS
ncbi:MAG: hypothetical protein JNM43_11635 [Planctomycetaceae bacterium]|nr:hypothetical protein [Planctomycetaceae bacterium]